MGDSICKFSSHMKASCSTPLRLALNNHQKSNKDVYKRQQKSPWEFTKAKHSWTYPGKEGELTNVEVYSAGDEVELYRCV